MKDYVVRETKLQKLPALNGKSHKSTPHSVEIYNPKQFSNIGCNLSCPLFEKNERGYQTQQHNVEFRCP